MFRAGRLLGGSARSAARAPARCRPALASRPGDPRERLEGRPVALEPVGGVDASVCPVSEQRLRARALNGRPTGDLRWIRPAPWQARRRRQRRPQRPGPRRRVLRGVCDAFFERARSTCSALQGFAVSRESQPSLAQRREPAGTPIQLDDEEPVGGSDDSGVVAVRPGYDCAEVRGDHDEALGGSPVRLGAVGEGFATARQGAFTAKPGDEAAALDVTGTVRRCEARAGGA